VVYMPAGTFRIDSGIYQLNRSNFTLRGAGQGQTILKGGISLRGNVPWPPPTNDDWIAISSGATKGSNTITLPRTSAFAVDMPIVIGPSVLPTWAHNLSSL